MIPPGSVPRHLRRSVFHALLLTTTPFSLAVGSKPAPAPVTITVAMRDPAAFEVSYEMPSTCSGLQFGNPGGIRPQAAAAVRSDWSALDACTEVDEHGVRPRHPGCQTMRVRVPATTRSHDSRVYDRVYPWALPVGGGLLTHTSAFAVTPSCGPVAWRFTAPGGTVVVDGVASAELASRTASAEDVVYLPAMLLAEPYRRDAPPVHFDATVGAANRTLLEDTLQSVRRQYERMLHGLPISVPYVVASSADTRVSRSYVAHLSMMNLTLPLAPTSAEQTRLRLLIAHESAHMVQSTRTRDTWADEAATINEGGAEFLSLVAATQLGWIAPTEFKDKLEVAVNDCMLAIGGSSWKSFEEHTSRGQPYTCGLMFYALALNEHPTGSSALVRVRDYERQARSGVPTAFPSALECGGQAGCAPRWLSRIAGHEALEEVLHDYAQQPGALLRPASNLNPALAQLLGHQHFRKLMERDCKGEISIYPEQTAERIGPVSRCTTLREGMRIVTAERLALLEGGKGLQASVQACRERGRTLVGTADGAAFELLCDASFALPSTLAVDLEQAVRLTK